MECRKIETMVPQRIIEGTGEEISQYARAHPHERFQLIVLSQDNAAPEYAGPSPETLTRINKTIESFRGKMPVLESEAFSSEALYD